MQGVVRWVATSLHSAAGGEHKVTVSQKEGRSQECQERSIYAYSNVERGIIIRHANALNLPMLPLNALKFPRQTSTRSKTRITSSSVE